MNQDYIANIQRITITKEEMMMISSYKDLIIKDFKRFLNTYKRKIKNNLNENLLKFTSLQYFQRELGL